MPVAAVIPKEGATGWADSYMLSTKAKHPNCAYRWMQYITQPKPQAQQAIYFGETPVNKKACKVMDRCRQGLVRAVLGEQARGVLPLDQVLEDARRRLRQRAEELHGPAGLDNGLDAGQGLAAAGLAADPARLPEGSPAGGALRALSRFSWRRPRLKTLGQISAPVAAFVFVYVAALARAPDPGVLDDRLVHGEGHPLVEPRQLPRDRGRALPDDHPADGRDGDRRDAHVHGARLPVRVLHGPRRGPAAAGDPARRDRARRCGSATSCASTPGASS